MMPKKELERWLSTLPEDADVAIDEGGLTIVEVNPDGSQGEAYLEVGMMPEEEQEES